MEMIPVQVEADVSDGMPQFTMVGYVSAQVKEAQDRVRTALKNMEISLPPKRITINLSPADVRKEGSRFDLPIAAGVLMTLGRIPPRSLRKTMVLGELGLDGRVQEISGVFPAAAKARELGCTTTVLPFTVYPVRYPGVKNVRVPRYRGKTGGVSLYGGYPGYRGYPFLPGKPGFTRVFTGVKTVSPR